MKHTMGERWTTMGKDYAHDKDVVMTAMGMRRGNKGQREKTMWCVAAPHCRMEALINLFARRDFDYFELLAVAVCMLVDDWRRIRGNKTFENRKERIDFDKYIAASHTNQEFHQVFSIECRRMDSTISTSCFFHSSRRFFFQRLVGRSPC